MNDTPPNRPLPDGSSESINALGRRFWESAVLRAGIRLGVFRLLDERPRSAADVARALDASPAFVRSFLDACVALELLEQRDDAYANTPRASSFLVPGRDGYVGDLALHITNHWAVWGQLDRLVREGRTLTPPESGYTDAAAYWRDYMLGQHNRAQTGQARRLVESVDLSGRRKLLDLGGGAASYSIALCRAYPELHATVVDFPEPLQVARRLVAEQGLQQRITLVEGDFLDVPLGDDSDVVLISGVVVAVSKATVRRLFRAAFDALRPGGLVVVQDFMRIDTSPARRFMDAMMDLYLRIAFNPDTGDYAGEEVAAWLQQAGFRAPALTPLPTHLALVTAHKPQASPPRSS